MPLAVLIALQEANGERRRFLGSWHPHLSSLCSMLHEDSATWETDPAPRESPPKAGCRSLQGARGLLKGWRRKDASQLLYFFSCFLPQSKLHINNGQDTTTLWLLLVLLVQVRAQQQARTTKLSISSPGQFPPEGRLLSWQRQHLPGSFQEGRGGEGHGPALRAGGTAPQQPFLGEAH